MNIDKIRKIESTSTPFMIPRSIGTLEYCKRVFNYGQYADEPFAMILYTHFAFDNLCEYITKFHPYPDDPDFKDVVNDISKFLNRMAAVCTQYAAAFLDAYVERLPSKDQMHSDPLVREINSRVNLQKEPLVLTRPATADRPALTVSIMFDAPWVNPHQEPKGTVNYTVESALLFDLGGLYDVLDAALNKTSEPNKFESSVRNDMLYMKFLRADAYKTYWENTKKQLFHRAGQHSFLYQTPGVPADYLFIPIYEARMNYDAVRSVYISIYRMDPDSEIVSALGSMAQNGVDVNVFIEMHANGSEKDNKIIADRLSQQGAHVTTEYLDLKVHMKTYLIEYMDGRRLAMIGTGNYNTKTMAHYIDYHMITSDYNICQELRKVYDIVTGKDAADTFSDNSAYFWNSKRSIYVSPISLRDRILSEISSSKHQIIMKCNNFGDKQLIDSLYRWARKTGKKAGIICRSSCSIAPDPTKVLVRSKIGSNLQHARVYLFDDHVYITSADLLTRNLNQRVEVMVRLPSEVTTVMTEFRVEGSHVHIVEETLAEHIGNLWKECNFEMDPLTCRWRYRKSELQGRK